MKRNYCPIGSISVRYDIYYIRDISEFYYIKVCVNNALTYVTYACQRMSSI
ncbi:hypothetical protein HanLR1_Chr01g0032061 [Helianthus annuus]|nr:hypothetical protein HanHA89_Chr01g0033561 [Helianthus annuus]KAJ0784437.1 hypothetical protein HanLR1_Chr01g0032061 [Helianthus annuus]